ncbi:MAG: hypothetical protein ACI9VR_001499 [Cognaticolwellia sp.]|jgi:hypothetical protein
MLGWPWVLLDGFPVALLFDDLGVLRMMRLQGLPETPLAELELACLASAMAGLHLVSGVKIVELQLNLF